MGILVSALNYPHTIGYMERSKIASVHLSLYENADYTEDKLTHYHSQSVLPSTKRAYYVCYHLRALIG